MEPGCVNCRPMNLRRDFLFMLIPGCVAAYMLFYPKHAEKMVRGFVRLLK